MKCRDFCLEPPINIIVKEIEDSGSLFNESKLSEIEELLD